MDLTVNGKTLSVDAPEDMPLLWVLREVIGLTGTKFGYGIAACGACTIHLNGEPIRSCNTPVRVATDKPITTIEAIGGTAPGKKIQDAWIALDVPQCVNPDSVKAQIESGIVYGISATLWGEITVKNGRVEQKSFPDYRVLRMNEMPEIQVHLVKSGQAPGGIGEPGTAGTAGAPANAVFAATGKRIRALPLQKALKA